MNDLVDSKLSTFADALAAGDPKWLADARRNGANQHEAEEVALPHILLPSEKDEAQTESQ